MDPRFNISPLSQVRPVARPGTSKPSSVQGNAFDLALREALSRSSGTGGDLTVTAHAEKRLQERGIRFDPETKQLLGQALDELQAKGARDSLVLTGNAAFVVNVPTRTLVTAMDPADLRDRIVTQIDSVSIKHHA